MRHDAQHACASDAERYDVLSAQMQRLGAEWSARAGETLRALDEIAPRARLTSETVGENTAESGAWLYASALIRDVLRLHTQHATQLDCAAARLAHLIVLTRAIAARCDEIAQRARHASTTAATAVVRDDEQRFRAAYHARRAQIMSLAAVLLRGAIVRVSDAPQS